MAQQLPDDFLYDSRLIERHITRGLITREEVEKRRAATTDMAEQADSIDIDQLGAGSRAAPKRTP